MLALGGVSVFVPLDTTLVQDARSHNSTGEQILVWGKAQRFLRRADGAARPVLLCLVEDYERV